MTSAASLPQVTFACQHCGTHNVGPVKGEHWASLDGREQMPYRYRLVSCSNCNDATLLLDMMLGSVQAPDGVDEDVFDVPVTVFPPQPRHLTSDVPKALRTCLEEARRCLASRAYTATAIMYRRALELLAHDQGIEGRNLARSLEKLRDDGIIDRALFEWADELRLTGNHAAHEVHTGLSSQDAADTRDLAEAIIDYVYVFQARYEAFKARRRGASGDPSTPPAPSA